MHRSSRPDALDLQQHTQTLTRARSRSIGSTDYALSSTASSTSSSNALASVSPEPAYIAASAATGIVTSDHTSFFNTLQDEGIIDSSPQTILVAPPSLRLVNQFLDFLLYSVLSASKSISLSALRPAITEVLRSRLAKEAIAGADHELQSYLGSEDEGVLDALQDGQEVGAEWDLDGTWRRTRLRCMVYSSLGDLEEDDEEVYAEFGHLEGTVGSQQYLKNSGTPGVVSPAVAIWLTAILEFIGEQTLLIAGHATIARYSAQRMAAAASEDGARAAGKFSERLTVDELDIEKVALNPSLGRMWRQWRKRGRHHARGSFSVSSRESGLHQGVLQRLERQASSTSWRSGAPSENSDKLPIELPKSSYGTIVGNNDVFEAEQYIEEINALEDKAVRLESGERDMEGPLSPIVESASPQHEPVGKNEIHQTENDEAEDMLIAPDSPKNPGRRRPQSLIILPCTTESPFILPSRAQTLRRPRSLPSLERGDFPDPLGGGHMERMHMELREHELGRPSICAENKTKILREVKIPKAVDYPKVDGENDSTSQTAPVHEDVRSVNGVARTSDDASPQKRLPPSIRERRQESGKLSANQQLSNSGGSEMIGTKPIETSFAECDGSDETTQHMGASQPVDSVKTLPSIHEHGLYTREEQIKRVSGPPSTTNLRELVEAFVTSSDDDSSIAASNKESLVRAHSENESSSHSKQLSTGSSKYSQQSDRKNSQNIPGHPSSSSLSISSDRGAGMRIWTPPATPNKSRRSSSFSKMSRPTHTSSSSASQASVKLKTFMTWPTETGKYGKVQDSDDDSRSSLYSEKHAQRLANMDDKERSFEELISSGGTIHCTITPDPLRNMEPSKRTPTSELADFFRNTSPDVPKGRGSNKRPTVSRLTSSNSSRTFLSEDVPLPPRVPTSQSQQTFSSKKSRSLASAGSTVTTPRPKHIPLASVGITGIPSVLTQQREEPQPTGSRKMVARDASGSTGGDSVSALADFFRNTTPPVDGEQVVTRRISRSVAPFRNTMDSTQFGPDACDVIEVDAINETPRNDGFITSSVPPESYQSSSTSSTALLRSNSRKNNDYGSTGSVMPERKQRRVRDPYAIDIDDLDDEDLEGLGSVIPPNKNTEESLADFLRSTLPPSVEMPAHVEEYNKTVEKKNSSVSLISRFGRSSTRKNSISSTGSGIPPMPPVAVPKYVPIPIVLENISQPKQVEGSGGATPSNYRTDFDSMVLPRNSSFQQRRNMQQARGATTDRTRTDSLVDFLKNSEPPVMIKHPQSPPSKEESGLAKFKIAFSRKQKRSEFSGVV
ncbi:hypothetical protein RUND412_002840 [Rhizina undulata]